MNNDFSLFTDARVLVIGDVMLDRYIWGNVHRISPEGPVPVLHMKERSHTLGGASNVALNLSTLSCNVILAGICGNDENGSIINSLLQQHHIENRLYVINDRNTICKTRIIAQNQQLMRIDEENTSAYNKDTYIAFEKEIRSLFDDVNAVIVSDYGKGTCNDYLLFSVSTLCHNKKIPLFIDPKRENWDIYKGSTCITPNKGEFLLAIGKKNATEEQLAESALLMINKYNLQYILLTRGSEGITLYSRNDAPTHIPAKAKEVFDVSGAGDAVISTLAACVSVGETFENAARIANISGSIAVGKIGTQPVYRDELSRAIKCSSHNNHKLCSLPAALTQVVQWRSESKKIVFTNGCFDLLHVGHIQLLHAAREKGDRLVVGLNSDNSVQRIKGPNRPVLPAIERASILIALECVDLVIIFEEDTPLAILRTLQPDILVKGGDYTRETAKGFETIESWGGRVEIIPLLERASSENIINKIMSHK